MEGGQGNFVSIFTSLGVFRAKNGGIFTEMKRRISQCYDHTKYFKTLAPNLFHCLDNSIISGGGRADININGRKNHLRGVHFRVGGGSGLKCQYGQSPLLYQVHYYKSSK